MAIALTHLLIRQSLHVLKDGPGDVLDARGRGLAAVVTEEGLKLNRKQTPQVQASGGNFFTWISFIYHSLNTEAK